MKIRLPNRNVANRVLPIRIHDLDSNDFKICESIMGGSLRGIDFIYKEQGVNRPLRPNEEDPHQNLYHTTYRNQLNKVALAIKEIISGIKTESVRLAPEETRAGKEEVKESGNGA